MMKITFQNPVAEIVGFTAKSSSIWINTKKSENAKMDLKILDSMHF